MRAPTTPPELGLMAPRDLLHRRSLWTVSSLALSIGLSGCAHRSGWCAPRPAAATPAAVRLAEVPESTGTLEVSPKLAALLPHFERQKTQASCSVASATLVLDALLTIRGRPAVAQEAILASDPSGAWQRATSTDPHAEGVTLEQLALFLKGASQAQGLAEVQVETVHVAAQDPNTVRRLTQVLEAGERDPGDWFVIVNFCQSMLAVDGDPIGHMSVVGMYDAAREQVLVLDVDPEIGPPYWVTLRALVASMQSRDDVTREPRGYLVIHIASGSPDTDGV